ncbi:hypothetical protein EDC01DRAFT_775968 [Geopyxis carbonaria]|nr:hypothetical protein EDC01DRAFT_775968 [Geopyxis carbonaria]
MAVGAVMVAWAGVSWRRPAADPKPPPPRKTTAQAWNEAIHLRFERCSDSAWLSRDVSEDAPAGCSEVQVGVVVEPAVNAHMALPLDGVGTGSYWLAAALPTMGEALLSRPSE